MSYKSNKSFFVLTCSLCLCMPFSLLTAQQQATFVATSIMTMEDCVTLALANNKTIQAAEARIKQTISDKNELRSVFLPHISLEGIIDNNSRSVSGDLTQFQDFHASHALGLSVSLGLWDFGSSINHLRASRNRIHASKLQKEFVSLNVEEQVKTVYLRILEKEKNIEVLRSSLQTLKQQLSTSQDLFTQGIVKNTDVLTVQVKLAEEEKRLLQLKNDLSNLKMGLNHLIGRPLFEEISLQNVLEKPCSFSFNNALDYALANRADLKAMRAQLEALRLDRVATRLSIAPKLYAFGNGNYSSETSTASVGIGLTMPLYEGGSREAKVDRLSSTMEEIRANLEDMEQIITLEIKKTFLQIEEIKESLSIDKNAIALAEENLKNTMKLYQEGFSSINDVLYSESQLNLVKMNYYSNLYRSHITCVHLVTITGGYSLNHYGTL